MRPNLAKVLRQGDKGDLETCLSSRSRWGLIAVQVALSASLWVSRLWWTVNSAGGAAHPAETRLQRWVPKARLPSRSVRLFRAVRTGQDPARLLLLAPFRGPRPQHDPHRPQGVSKRASREAQNCIPTDMFTGLNKVRWVPDERSYPAG